MPEVTENDASPLAYPKQTTRDYLIQEAEALEKRAAMKRAALLALPPAFLDLLIGELHAVGIYL